MPARGCNTKIQLLNMQLIAINFQSIIWIISSKTAGAYFYYIDLTWCWVYRA